MNINLLNLNIVLKLIFNIDFVDQKVEFKLTT